MARTTNVNTVGFIGTGKVSSKNISALMADYCDAKQGKVKFILPFTVNEFTETLEYVYQFALDYDIDVVAIYDGTTRDNKKLADILDSLGEPQLVENVISGVTGVLAATSDPTLVIAWDDEDEACLDALDAAVNHGILALDLTTGLQELKFDEPLGETEQTPTGESEVHLSESSDNTGTTQQPESVDTSVSDGSGDEARPEIDSDEALDKELDNFLPLTRVLERLDAIEKKVEALLERHPM